MKITIESTSKMVEVVRGGQSVPARVWEGTTESGIPVVVLVTRIAPAMEFPPAAIVVEFERELQAVATPRADLTKWLPMRMIL